MPPDKSRFLKFRKPLILVVLFTAAFIAVVAVYRLLLPVYSFSRQQGLNFSSAYSLLTNNTGLLKQDAARTNILLLGISGGDHEGSTLTDSIIFLSLDLEGSDHIMISVPRDIWLPSLKTKINSTYYYGEAKRQGGGITLTESAVSEIFGLPVHYAAVVDFETFKKVIDLLGGIDIEVESSFEDKKFPVPGKENDFCKGDPTFACRYETVRFEKGLQHIDGEEALKYVRSRNAENGEGNDFSRGKRQQAVLKAVAAKIKNSLSLDNLDLYKQLSETFPEAVDTDMKMPEMLLLGKFILKEKADRFRQIKLDTGDEQNGTFGILENPPVWQYDGQWVLVPKDADYDRLREYISCHLKTLNCSLPE